MKAITVKYFGPTNTKGSRLRVRCEALRDMVVPYDHSAHNPERVAVEAYLKRNCWDGEMIQGKLPTGESVFVFTPERENREGLTYRQWLTAAAVEASSAHEYAWSGGEDPIEYRKGK